MKKNLTEGSIRGLLSVSAPLMVSFLSLFSMGFIDRLFLGYYSNESRQACSVAGTPAWAFLLFIITLISMATVVVAQRNGAKQYNRLAESTWQMLYFSLFLTPFMFLFGAPLAAFFFPDNLLHQNYFAWSFYIAPSFFFLSSCSTFFTGQGRTSIIQWLALGGNSLNILLDYLLIFGWEGWLPPMGIKGALIATGLSTFVQFGILFAIFLSRKEQETFSTHSAALSIDQLFLILRLGTPQALSNLFETGCWAFFYQSMESASSTHIEISSILQTVVFLFFFFGAGLEKGIASIAGNLIGKRNEREIPNLLRSGTLLSIAFLFISFFLLYFFSSTLVSATLPSSVENGLELRNILLFSFPLLSLYLFFKNIRLLFDGVLIASGDTFFLLVSRVFSSFFFLLVPSHLSLVYHLSPIYTVLIWIFYSFLGIFPSYLRYANGSWMTRERFIQNPPTIDETLA